MAFHVLVSLMLCFTGVDSLYKALEDNATKYWASESKFDQDPLHSYSQSKLFCESLGGRMPIGSPEEMKFLCSFLPLASYPYWLGQGHEFGTWSDGSEINSHYESSHPECDTNCGIHYQSGKLVKISMNENSKANIICKVVIDGSFYIRLLLTSKVLLSSDQQEVVWAADFARSFLTIGFAIGVCFFVIFAVVMIWINLFLRSLVTAFVGDRGADAAHEESDGEEEERDECQPLQHKKIKVACKD